MASLMEDNCNQESPSISSNSLSDGKNVIGTLLAGRLDRLSSLRRRMAQAEAANQFDILRAKNESRVKKSSAPSEDISRQTKYRREEEKIRIKAAEEGMDPERLKNLSYSVNDVDAWEASCARRSERQDTGFKDFTQASHKKYKRMVAAIVPDLKAYSTIKQRAIEAGQDAERAFYGDINALDTSSTPSTSNVHRMTSDLTKQVAIRAKSSRRRTYNPNEDVSFINDKNRNFNRKIARFYDKYTQDIKESLERGTAL